MEVRQDILDLFEEVIEAYITVDSTRTEDDYDLDEYKFRVSRLYTKADEWKKELLGILDGEQTGSNKVGA